MFMEPNVLGFRSKEVDDVWVCEPNTGEVKKSTNDEENNCEAQTMSKQASFLGHKLGGLEGLGGDKEEVVDEDEERSELKTLVLSNVFVSKTSESRWRLPYFDFKPLAFIIYFKDKKVQVSIL